MRLNLTILLFLVVFLSTAQNREKAFEINQKLGRGINYGNMFEAPSETAWGNPWKPEYAGIIADLGFNHIRIPVRWEPSERSSDVPPYTIETAFLNRIKQVVDSALNNGLFAIINMHHHDVLFENPDNQKDRFLAQWKQISAFFKEYSDSLLFEILNEPHGNLTPEKWNNFVADVLPVIRENAPERIVLIGTPEYGGLSGLSALQLPNDENIIVTVHYYNPFHFTHQGASWVGSVADEWLGTKWTDTEDERNIVKQEFAPLITFSQQNHIPVHIGEFGAYSTADMVSRAKWTTFLSRYFEQLNWSWAYWEFCAGFGIYNPTSKTFFSELVDALLHNSMPEPAYYRGTAIYSSNFQSSTDGWVLYKQGSAAAQLSNTGDQLNISISNGSTEAWHVQLVKNNLSLEYGKKYRLTFKAKTESARNFIAYAGQSISPWSAYSEYSTVSSADAFQTFTLIFEMSETDNNARIVFDLGKSETDVFISEVKLEEIELVTPTAISVFDNFETKIYPNPFQNHLTIENNDDFKELSVFSLDGKLVFSSKIVKNSNSFDFHFLPPGSYLVSLFNSNKSFSQIVIKR